MVKYKVSFEITDVIGDFMHSNKEEWIEAQKQLIKEVVYAMELEHQDIKLIKVTDFRIEEVKEND